MHTWKSYQLPGTYVCTYNLLRTRTPAGTLVGLEIPRVAGWLDFFNGLMWSIYNMASARLFPVLVFPCCSRSAPVVCRHSSCLSYRHLLSSIYGITAYFVQNGLFRCDFGQTRSFFRCMLEWIVAYSLDFSVYTLPWYLFLLLSIDPFCPCGQE